MEEEFQLPFQDISPIWSKMDFIYRKPVKVNVIDDHPLTLGMPERLGYFPGAPVFQTSVPMFDMDRRVIGTYPEKEVLMSGYGPMKRRWATRLP